MDPRNTRGPTTRKGTAKIAPGRGVKIHNLYYWSDAFRTPDVEKRHVAIRYDPFDVGTAYAFIDKEWTECHSEYFSVFQGRSEKELMLAAEELRKSMQHQSGEFTVTSRKLAEFLDSVQAEEVLLEQRLGDMESRAGKATLTVVPKSTFPAEHSPVSTEDTSSALQTYGSF